MTVIGLRPATQADSEFCFRLHEAALGEYVAAIWGWDEQDQRDHHARVFDPGNTRIVTADGVDVGMLSVDYHPTEIYLGRIEIDPAYQGRGIGTRLITALLDEARRRGQDLLLDVLTVNRRAHALYRRLGLKEVARHGDGNIKIRMRYTPPAKRL
ncbi:GNAT family N-acetyltransferase [Microbispora sp. NPDC046933]|uniref:GNAT family N-acetyltransferase n=1 Tax=Microbispora sp. NPDC046933 TaxID=3155618 RepID=UPI0033DE8B3E